MAKSYSDYVRTEDFIGCIQRMNNANARWKKYWFECCEEIAELNSLFKEKYIFDEIHFTVQIKENKKFDDVLNNPHNYVLNRSNNYVYLIKFYDEENNFKMSKIGTTTRTLNARLKEHFRANTPYSRMGATKLIIDKIYVCNRNPQGLEDRIRSELMLKYTLEGRDQFIEDIDWEDYEEIIQEYLQKELDK